MKLLYDISVLGMAYHNEQSRTGIYRVIYNVARGLLTAGDHEVLFYSGAGNEASCLDFLAIHPEFSSCFVSRQPTEATITGDQTVRQTLTKLFKDLVRRVSPAGPERALLKSHPQLCHSGYFPLPDEVVKNHKIAKVQTVHDLIPLMMPNLFAFGNDELIRRVLAGLDPETFVICMSEATRNDLLEFKKNLDPAKVRVIYSAATDNFRCCDDAEVQTVRQRYGIPVDAKYILSVSTLEPRKNLDTVIRAFTSLVKAEHLNDLYLVLTGTQGWSFDGLLAQIENAGEIRERIVLTGFVPDTDLAPLYSSATAFVYMSLYEGFGLPPLEAMKCGTPVITSNTSSIPEVVGDGGIMLDPQDVDALGQAMLDLYKDESLRVLLSRKALARSSRFSWNRCVAETMAVYRQADESRCRAGS